MLGKFDAVPCEQFFSDMMLVCDAIVEKICRLVEGSEERYGTKAMFGSPHAR